MHCLFYAEALEFLSWKVSEDIHWSCEHKILYSSSIFNHEWQVYCQRLGGQMCLPLGPAVKKSSAETGRPH